MFVWQSGGDTINLGTVEERNCNTCEKQRPFDLILQYRYWGFFWIFNMVTEKKYLLHCDVCHRGWQLDTQETEETLETSPIPFMRRYGLLIYAAVVIGVIVLTLGGLLPV